MDLTQALYTTRAMRRVLPDPIPTIVIKAMLDAAVRSPSGGNSQNWRFVAVADPDTRACVGALYQEAFATLLDEVYGKALEKARREGDEGTLRVFRSAQWLADNAAQVPLWLFFYARGDESGASIYPAVWSAMLAARGHGVGTCLTTILGAFKAEETAALLGVPTDRGWKQAAAVPCGYPKGRWGLAARRPVHKVSYAERWGNPVSWTVEQPLWTG
ncbi:MAG: nitroreductase family protein [bacterium]|nr:nitroreductase family protein [Acidimicrobiia bacterium]MCY4648854.1 nitroreductase family protein [bacterium]